MIPASAWEKLFEPLGQGLGKAVGKAPELLILSSVTIAILYWIHLPVEQGNRKLDELIAIETAQLRALSHKVVAEAKRP